MNAQYTKRPWKLLKEKSHRNGETTIDVVDDLDTRVLTISYRSDQYTAGRNNAAQIVRDHNAMPDLLEACKQRINEWHANNANFDRKEPLSLAMMRAAIAKATKE